MPVNINNMNPEQKALNSADQFSREDEFAKKLVESFDLPSNLANEIDEKIEDEKRGPKKKEEEEEDVEDSEEEQASEDVEDDGDSESDESDEEEEDLIPKSKVQARIDELTREKKEMAARLRKLEQQAEEKRTPEDSDLQKLEAMDDAQLKALKRQVKAEQMNAVQAQDRAKLNELMDLEDKIDSVASNAPKRFADSQIRKFNEAVNETVSDGEIPNFKQASPQIFKKAQEIYAKSSSLKSSVNGQAEAWNLAVEHYKEVSKLSEGKSKSVETERKFNSLKKKVSVDSGVTKGTEQAETDRKTFQKAKHGTEDDKLNFFKKSVISQDMYKPNKS